MSTLGQHWIMSDQTKEKISKAQMGHTMSDSVAAALLAANIGRPLSEEHRARLSVVRKGIPKTEETKVKMSASKMGHEVTNDARAKMSAAHKKLIGLLSSRWSGGSQVSNVRQRAKRRTLGFNPLNSWFVGCEGHHINKSDVIYLPRKLHRSISHNQWTGKGMAEMNALAGQYLTEDWT